VGFKALANSYLGNHANTKLQCTESTKAQETLQIWGFVSIASTIIVVIVLSAIIMHALQRIKQV